MLVGIAVPLGFVGLRLAIDPLLGDQSPYALNFPAVIIATVLAGWRSGLLAIVVSQALAWILVVGGPGPAMVIGAQRELGFAGATLSLLMVLLVVALYQREVDRGVVERERRIRLFEQARREIDHRIRNNFQTVLALIHLQAQRSGDGAVRDALRQIGDRVAAIARATEHLAVRDDDLATVSLGGYLCDLCEELERGLVHDGLTLRCDVDDVGVPVIDATYLALVVNELVTNAIKHAFHNGDPGEVTVSSALRDGGYEIVVADNGGGMKNGHSTSGSGLGQKLVKTFVRELGARHEVASSDKGTAHRIFVPARI